ncbi:hypothetical protein IB277_31860 [Ensifer sp. ENS07]|uniref:hypothetical protein n=1 Tax=Ensifer sp. ENS07 TaxID=2769274 RepID=UPI00177D6D49|nr:hypothetical protein [Ensifer sp. ENS07]MBD9640898.1 hypothetical protein [Ensifer sp. ENS07]
MTKARRFADIPTNDFPLNAAKYKRLRSDIRAAAVGFDNLGTTAGQSVCHELSQAQHHLEQAWNLIQAIEESERRREWGMNTD